MINKDSYGFNTFVATRIGEMQTATKPHEWYWTDSNNNIADIISCGASIKNIDSQSRWVKGPDFLKLPINELSIRQDCTSSCELPEKIDYALSSKTSS